MIKFCRLATNFVPALKRLGFDSFVEPFDPVLYNNQSTLGENLLFGTATAAVFPRTAFIECACAQNIAQPRPRNQLFVMGKEVAATTVELFGDLSADNPFFDQLNYMDAEDLPLYRAALLRIGESELDAVSEEDQELILRLPFAYTETRNRLGITERRT